MEIKTDIDNVNDIPNIGPATKKYLNILGINRPFELIGQKTYSMFRELCKVSCKRFDPCLADVFISAVKYTWKVNLQRNGGITPMKEREY